MQIRGFVGILQKSPSKNFYFIDKFIFKFVVFPFLDKLNEYLRFLDLLRDSVCPWVTHKVSYEFDFYQV